MIHHGDCIDVLPTLEADSVDACVTDPPYALTAMSKRWAATHAGDRQPGAPPFNRHSAGFMGKAWDSPLVVFDPATWALVLRVLKPGAHLLAFGGTRTYHRLVCAIEDAGFEIRDTITWLYGSGFPKSLDVSKAIDKAAGAQREVLAEGAAVRRMIPGADQNATGSWIKDNGREFVPTETAPATEDAQRWDGWGTALKPACELIVLARKPLSEKSVAANVLRWGTGALNIDASRIGYVNEEPPDTEHWKRTSGGWKNTSAAGVVPNDNSRGRWPANVALDEEVAVLIDEQSGVSVSRAAPEGAHRFGTSGGIMGSRGSIRTRRPEGHNDSGGASRFFYTAKADSEERNVNQAVRNAHPTVKPLALMVWLLRLVTPPNGVILDPFLGSGTTALAAIGNGFAWIGIERERQYVDIAEQRIGLML